MWIFFPFIDYFFLTVDDQVGVGLINISII